MSTKILILFRDGDEKRIAIERERMTLGRDSGCDVVLADESVSRRHATLHHKHGAIYIENISSTGRVLRFGEPVEYVEVEEGDEIVIGPYTLSWTTDEKSPMIEAPAEPAALATEEPAFKVPLDAPLAESPGFDPPPESATSESPRLRESDSDCPESPEVSSEDLTLPVVSAAQLADEDEKTVPGAAAIAPRLRIVKGPSEEVGRELRLSGGPQWIVGRSPKAHIQIDHAKFSRQHFSIQKIGDQFRIQDMASANGTRLNGVAVTDAPLQPFDTIQVGPYELQFVLVDQEAQHLAAAAPPPLPSLQSLVESPSFKHDNSAEQTQFVPPVPYDPLQGFKSASAGASLGAASPYSTPTPTPEPGARTNAGPAPGSANASPLLRPFLQLSEWFKSQPKEKQRLYGISASLLVAIVIASVLGSGKGTEVETEIAGPVPASESAPSPDLSMAVSEGNVSPEFFALSAEKRAQIEDDYRQAEKARAAQDWNTAYDKASAIARVVPRYKDTNAILDEAQAVMLEKKIGTISQSSSRVDEAARENEEKVEALLESAKKALAEQRFADADETFHKILNYDPSNKEAQAGIVAARNRQSTITEIDLPSDAVTSFQDENAAERQRERDSLDAFKARYQEIRRAMQSGRFKEASPQLVDLEKQVSLRVDEYDQGTRAPAAVRPEFRDESAKLLNQIREARDALKTQFRAEFQSQLADAEQHIANRQYALARETYDSILRDAPNFDEVIDARQRLYDKLVSEAKVKYHEALVYESVGDVDGAVEGYSKVRELLTNVADPNAVDYYKKSVARLRRLVP